jgi:methylthioxylose transferase
VTAQRSAASARVGTLVGIAMVGLVAATTVYGVSSRRLGAGLPPFFLWVHPRVSAWLAPAIVVVAGSLVAAGRLMGAERHRFMLGSAVLALTARLAVNMIRFGPPEWARPFISVERRQEYPTAIRPYGAHPLAFVGRFAHLVPHLAVHPAGHPPGPTLIAITLARIGLAGPWPLALLLIGVGSLAAPLTYLAARELGCAQRDARVAALVWTFAPASMIESVTSMDAVFCTLGIGTIVLLVRGRRVIAGVAVWACSFMSYSLAAAPVWALMVIAGRRSFRDALGLAVACAVAVVGIDVALHVWLGFDPIAAFQATQRRYLHGPGTLATRRPIAFWIFGDLAAFLAGLGLPLVIAFGRALVDRRLEALALLAISVAGAASGYSKGEVERIWLFMVPLAAIATACIVGRWPLRFVLALLAAQAVAVECVFATVW